MRLIHRQLGWPELDEAAAGKARRMEIFNFLCDPNLGPNLARGKFKVLKCKRVGTDPDWLNGVYQIEIAAKKNVIKDIIYCFSGDQFVTVNKKKSRVDKILKRWENEAV